MYKYLEITLHDNDFISEIKLSANSIYSIIHWLCEFEVKDMEMLKVAIQHILYGTHVAIKSLDDYDGKSVSDISKFSPSLRIIDSYHDIPDDKNRECAYIPLYEDGLIIFR